MFSVRGKLRNPIFGNILIALYIRNLIDFEIGKNSILLLRVFNLVLGGSFEIPFFGNIFIALYKDI